jgi:hypothetical protein
MADGDAPPSSRAHRAAADERHRATMSHGECVQPVGAIPQMTYVWGGVGVVLVLGLGLIVWGSMSGPGRSGDDVSARRSRQMQVGAVLVAVSLGALVIAYLTADWP